MKVLCVAGARPNFVKIAPILRSFRHDAPHIEVKLVHTGQHYDYGMNQSFFDQLEIPKPDISLEVGSASHAVQTAEIMKGFEPVLDEEQPDLVMVVGDVNSTVACALVAAKKNVRVAHVEAGLRSGDRSMPEEINRVLTDQIAELLYVTEQSGIDNLLREGKAKNQIIFVGNVMIDNLYWSLDKAVDPKETLGENAERVLNAPHGFALLTLHRPSNVDDPETLKDLLSAVVEISTGIPVVFPIHPRTLNQIKAAGLAHLLDTPGFCAVDPIGYLEMTGLLSKARVVLTDSGGLQEESTALGIPCVTMRENTERPITIEQGTNTLVGRRPRSLKRALDIILAAPPPPRPAIPGWDGCAASRIVEDIVTRCSHSTAGNPAIRVPA